MDVINTSIRRIVITEDEDLDLDKLLQVSSTSSPPSAPSSSVSKELPAAAHSAIPSKQRGEVLSSPPSSPFICASEDEEEDEGFGHWMLPPPAKSGDYLAGSMHKVPSKSILKKTSSYGNFEQLSTQSSDKNINRLGRKSSALGLTLDSSKSSSISQGSGSGRGVAVSPSPLDMSRSDGVSRRKKQSSFLSFGSSTHSNHSQGGSIGWNLDADNSSHGVTPMNAPSKFFVPSIIDPLTSVPSLSNINKADVDASDADPLTSSAHSNADRAAAAAGLHTSGSRHSLTNSTGRIRRNVSTVSFSSVNVREYDRTVGDNPSCRSGPPISLDWSYAEKSRQDLDEYELDRSSTRVSNIRKLHMNKYKRRNVLAFHWGHSEDEMKGARRDTKKMQRQRSMTQNMYPIHVAQEACIGIKNFITKKKKKSGEDGSVGNGSWSDMSNSGSTKDSTQRHSVASAKGMLRPSHRTASCPDLNGL